MICLGSTDGFLYLAATVGLGFGGSFLRGQVREAEAAAPYFLSLLLKLCRYSLCVVSSVGQSLDKFAAFLSHNLDAPKLWVFHNINGRLRYRAGESNPLSPRLS